MRNQRISVYQSKYSPLDENLKNLPANAIDDVMVSEGLRVPKLSSSSVTKKSNREKKDLRYCKRRFKAGASIRKGDIELYRSLGDLAFSKRIKSLH